MLVFFIVFLAIWVGLFAFSLYSQGQVRELATAVRDLRRTVAMPETADEDAGHV